MTIRIFLTHYASPVGQSSIPTSAVVLSVITLIVEPERTVRCPGFNDEVVAAKVAPAGIAAVAPLKSTQMSVPGWGEKATIQIG
jgi:hypothetical protein